MTLEEAISELQRGMIQNRSTNNQRLREALNLSAEHLKKLNQFRRGIRVDFTKLLPGETP